MRSRKTIRVTKTAKTLLAAGGVVGVQILNEFVAVALRKLAMPWKEVLEALSALRVLCPSPMPITVEAHDTALRISGRDSLIIAVALEARCATLYSEDMPDGQVIEGLRLRNPFREI